MARVKTLGSRLRPVELLTAPPQAKAVDTFYLSPAWRSLVSRLIGERGRQCEKCTRTGTRIFGDHIIELADGGAPLDPGNVQLLCGSCHSIKTARARSARVARTRRIGASE